MKETYNLIYAILVIILYLVFFNSCSSKTKYSKDNHLFTDLIADQLYSEAYRIESYGVGGDIYSMYLTDSLNFRKFISLYYDNESFEYKIDNNEVLIIKKQESGGVSNPKFKKRAIEKYRFSLISLKEQKKFE